MKPKDLSMSSIEVGDQVTFDRTFTEEDVKIFANLSGDMSPLHMDEDFASKTKFKKRVVHGMLVSSLCSRLVGMHLPGKRCLYLGQTLEFKEPVYINDTVTLIGTVLSKSVSIGLVKIIVSIKKDSIEVVSGIATVQVLS